MLTTSTTPSTRSFFFFFNDTATTEIYTLSLHDALPIWQVAEGTRQRTAFMAEELGVDQGLGQRAAVDGDKGDRKSTRLNSSHLVISYAVFCLKKKKQKPHFLSRAPTASLHLVRRCRVNA